MNDMYFYRIFIQLFVIFITITLNSGSSYFSKCISESSRGSKLLLHGRPPRCFPAGLQGPCSSHEVLLPRSETSSDGVCQAVSPNSEISSPLTHLKKRDITEDAEYYDNDDESSQQLTKMFMNSRCPTKGEMYSMWLKRCIPKGPANLKQGVLG